MLCEYCIFGLIPWLCHVMSCVYMSHDGLYHVMLLTITDFLMGIVDDNLLSMLNMLNSDYIRGKH